MHNDPTSPDDADSALPPRLHEALARLDAPIDIPPTLDAEILSRAKADYARRLRFRLAARWVAAGASLAAAVAIVFIVRATLLHPPPPLAKGDINGNGKVDMLDAYVLAKHLAAGDKIDPKWDMNGDGVVDQRDVDWIANHAVQINPVNAGTGGTQ
jgi:Dockerin type I domain